MSEDEELAEQMPDLPPRTNPPLAEFTPEVEQLMLIADRLGELINATVVNRPDGKGKPTRLKPVPRPLTAATRVRARRMRAEALAMETKLFPKEAR